MSAPVPPGSADFAGPASGPPAVDGLYRAGLLDGPTERLPGRIPAVAAPPAGRPRRGRLAVLAVAVAGLALVAAGGSAWFSWQALDRADAAGDLARRPVPAGATMLAGPADAAATPEPPQATAGLAAGPATEFEVGYEAEPMTFQIGCSAVLYIDLDEPRVNVDEQDSDLRYASTCGSKPPTISLGAGADAGSQVTAATRTAQDCARQLRTRPLGPRASVPVQAGVVLCVLTSLDNARERGDGQRLVLLTVTALNGNATANLSGTSWVVQQ